MIDTGEQKKVHYRLRRVGRPATKSSVKDIMKYVRCPLSEWCVGDLAFDVDDITVMS